MFNQYDDTDFHIVTLLECEVVRAGDDERGEWLLMGIDPYNSAKNNALSTIACYIPDGQWAIVKETILTGAAVIVELFVEEVEEWVIMGVHTFQVTGTLKAFVPLMDHNTQLIRFNKEVK